jgi:hypothetical protein
MCPGIAVDLLGLQLRVGLQGGVSVQLGGTRLLTVQVCTGGGPATPF